MGIDWEGIPMSQRELHRYHTLRLVREGRITGAQAAAAAQGIEGNYVPLYRSCVAASRATAESIRQGRGQVGPEPAGSQP